MRALAAQPHTGPDGAELRVGRSTLDEWIRAWRKGGFEALKPAPRALSPKVPADVFTIIRLTGQDVSRWNLQSHRHAVLFDQEEDGEPYSPLQNLSPTQAPVEIQNSPLCENGALGFEYGYSLDYPDGLILWEAQFGDFGVGERFSRK